MRVEEKSLGSTYLESHAQHRYLWAEFPAEGVEGMRPGRRCLKRKEGSERGCAAGVSSQLTQMPLLLRLLLLRQERQSEPLVKRTGRWWAVDGEHSTEGMSRSRYL